MGKTQKRTSSTSKTMKNKTYTEADIKACEKSKYAKDFIEKSEKLSDLVMKLVLGVQKKGIANAQKMAKTSEEKKHLKTLKAGLAEKIRMAKNVPLKKLTRKRLEDAFKKTYCNIGCKDTVLEAGKKLSDTMLNNIKDKQLRKMMKPFLEEQRKKIFGKKTNVLKDNFYEKLSADVVKSMKADGALSGCTIKPADLDEAISNMKKEIEKI
jgi:hypothetical protein